MKFKKKIDLEKYSNSNLSSMDFTKRKWVKLSRDEPNEKIMFAADSNNYIIYGFRR